MKKICLVIAILLVAQLFCLSVSAANLTLEGSTVSGNIGDTVCVSVSITNNTGFAGLCVYITYDENALSLKTVTNGLTALTFTKGAQLLWDGADDYTGTGSLVTLEFEILQGAQVGNSYEIGINVTEAYDIEIRDVPHVTTSGHINIICSHTGATTSVAATPATCQEFGYTAGVQCDVCGEFISGHEQTPKADHTYGAWTNLSETDHKHVCTVCGAEEKATHTFATVWSADGESHWHECTACSAKKDVEAHVPDPCATEILPQTCTVCGYVLDPAIAHVHQYSTTWTTDYYKHWHAAICGHDLKSAESAHDFVNGVCSVCGMAQPSEGLGYETNGDGTCALDNVGTCDEDLIIVPSIAPSGDVITSIGSGAFSGGSFSNIKLPETIVSIEENAFASCTNLKSIMIPTSVTSIDASAFTGSGLTKIIGYADSYAKTFADDNGFDFIALAKVNSKQLVLGTDIRLRLYAFLSDAEEGATMRVTMNGKSVELVGEPTSEEPYEFMFEYRGIAPQCLGDDITAELVLGGVVIDDTYSDFSVLTYCKDVLARTAAQLNMSDSQYEAFKTLVADLMEYGAKAQIYKNHNISNLVTSDEVIAALTKTAFVAPDETAQMIATASTDSENVRFKTANVYFDYDNKLMFKFTAKGVDENFRIKVTYPNSTVKYYSLNDCELVDAETATYILYTDSITAPKLSGNGTDYYWYTVELKTSAESETSIQQLRYSIASYVYSKQNGGNAMADLAKALYTYGCSAYAYTQAK